ncbi:MAG: Stp1/IreP family PP2C-type Ser/Thr phosphatase [Clostridia bacterium]|nr:Stp1/IreP family PP2C-type Ser/Thr phosphatase [Clostridia bacterium]
MKTVCRTDVGRVRKVNEDATHIQDGFIILCDGMGGHKAGDVAAIIAVETVREAVSGKAPCVSTLRFAVQKANEDIYRRAESCKHLHGMGTTLTALWMDRDAWIVAQVGDSRAYLYRDGILRQCTHDHSYVAELVRSGMLTQEEARTHPQRNIITRSLGTDPQVTVDLFEINRQPLDRWLLSSDGLTDNVDDSEMAAMLGGKSLDSVADALMSLALSRGGMDNITLILAEDDGGDRV